MGVEHDRLPGSQYLEALVRLELTHRNFADSPLDHLSKEPYYGCFRSRFTAHSFFRANDDFSFGG